MEPFLRKYIETILRMNGFKARRPMTDTNVLDVWIIYVNSVDKPVILHEDLTLECTRGKCIELSRTRGKWLQQVMRDSGRRVEQRLEKNAETV